MPTRADPLDEVPLLGRFGISALRLPSPAFPIWLLAADPSRCERLLHLLSAAERERANRFRTEGLRGRYIAAHSALRLLGERYLGFPASSPYFEANELGKPRLWRASGTHCSISYSGPHALVALSAGDEIGLDVETIRPINDAHSLMEMHYTPLEQQALRRFPPASRSFDEAFLMVWVRKEACVKALGKGLDVPLSTFECGVGMQMRIVDIGGRSISTGTFRSQQDLLVAWARCV